MNKQIEISKELKRWNWGAFLLTPLWCLRHGVWFGLFLILPLFGLFVPFILGATGNRRAWKKNPSEPIKTFLKRQRNWGIAGIVIWASLLIFVVGSFSYNLNYSHGMKMGLELANSTTQLTEYFGNPIKKLSFFEGEYNYSYNYPQKPILKISFGAVGPKNKGTIHFKWIKTDNEWVITELHFIDSEGKSQKLVDSSTNTCSFSEHIDDDLIPTNESI